MGKPDRTKRVNELIEESMETAPHKPEPPDSMPSSHRNAICQFWQSTHDERGVEAKYLVPTRVALVPSKEPGYFWLQHEFHERISREDSESAVMRSAMAAVTDELVLQLMRSFGVPMLHVRSARFELVRNLVFAHQERRLETALTRISRVCGLFYASFAYSCKEKEVHSIDEADRKWGVLRAHWYNQFVRSFATISGVQFSDDSIGTQVNAAHLGDAAKQRWFPEFPSPAGAKWACATDRAQKIFTLNDVERDRIAAAIQKHQRG